MMIVITMLPCGISSGGCAAVDQIQVRYNISCLTDKDADHHNYHTRTYDLHHYHHRIQVKKNAMILASLFP